MPKGLENTSSGPTVFSDPQSKLVIEWAPAGHPTGEHVRFVPDHLMDDINLMRVINRGILKPIDEAAAREALRSGGESWSAAQTAQATAHLESIDNKTEDDMISVPCQGPGHPKDDPAASVIVKAGELSQAPPLCAHHTHLADNFEIVQTASGKRRWARKEAAGV